MSEGIRLREVQDGDLPNFFQHQQDEEAVFMAAFTHYDPSDRPAFDAHWARIRGDRDVIIRTILCDAAVVGYVASYVLEGKRYVSYWIDRAYWGRGIATVALSMFVRLVPERPLYGNTAVDNHRSRKVLEKCGFKFLGEAPAYAEGRGEHIGEAYFTLTESGG